MSYQDQNDDDSEDIKDNIRNEIVENDKHDFSGTEENYIEKAAQESMDIKKNIVGL